MMKSFIIFIVLQSNSELNNNEQRSEVSFNQKFCSQLHSRSLNNSASDSDKIVYHNVLISY